MLDSTTPLARARASLAAAILIIRTVEEGALPLESLGSAVHMADRAIGQILTGAAA